MSDLDEVLRLARHASKQERIDYRNAIAGHGSQAVPEMRRWATDPDLGAFAVRVLEKIAEQPTDRRAVVQALESVDRQSVSPAVAGDISDALLRLRGRGVSSGEGSRTPTAPLGWAGYTAASPLEKRFHDDMLDVFRLAGEATRKQRSDGTFVRGYWATYFLRGVRNHGGLAYAHQLLRAEGTTEGFARLTEERRLDLTMEALVLRPEYESLFPETERQVAASRLARAGYQSSAT
jgi:hypothetical protein